ncbi:NAD-dependent deacylase [Desulfurococcaceae archaeon MEX13E-LK6-19]|nr:NAD-dependent deacylase [Desulfurococcaceae archaeon MEX13E-LK6-19]
MSQNNIINKVAEIIIRSKYCIAFTGAGISAESGIPTFRGRDGLWKKYRPEDLATPEAFARNPVLVWEWYKWRMEIVFKAKPNRAHIALAELEKMGLLKCVITQNVDGLHREAGSRCIVELHGSIRRVKCIECDYKSVVDKPPEEIPPKCPMCGGLLRPDVVWFGEPLPEDEWRKAVEHASRADTVLVIGTSGVVYPAAYIPYLVKENNGIVVEVNIDDTPITRIADYVLRGKAGEVLWSILEAVKALYRK